MGDQDVTQSPGILDKLISSLRGVGGAITSPVSAPAGVVEARNRYMVYRTNGGTLPFEAWVAQGEPAP